MFGHIGTAVKFFAIGLGVGLITAPRRGEETRSLLRRSVAGFFGLSEENASEMTGRMQSGFEHAQHAVRDAAESAIRDASSARQDTGATSDTPRQSWDGWGSQVDGTTQERGRTFGSSEAGQNRETSRPIASASPTPSHVASTPPQASAPNETKRDAVRVERTEPPTDQVLADASESANAGQSTSRQSRPEHPGAGATPNA